MNRISPYIFYSLWVLYAIYNVLWLIGITFSYGPNDTPSELIFVALTFIMDIPILWFSSKNLKIGLSLLAIVVACSLAAALSQHILSSFAFSFWYAPKIFIAVAAVWFNLSVARERRSTSNV